MLLSDSEDPIHNTRLLVESGNRRWRGAAGMADGVAEEMTLFRALLERRLFTDPAALELMLAAADRGYDLSDLAYGYGITKRQLHGLTCYGHGGAYDCDLYYCPAEKIGICTVLNQMNTHGRRDEFLQGAAALARQTKTSP